MKDKKTNIGEVLFGVLMTTVALSGLWFSISLTIALVS